VNPYLRGLILSYSARNRRRKAGLIADVMRRTGARRILLVGAMASGSERNEGIVERLVAVHAAEVVSLNIYDPGPQPWPYLIADGRLMPFGDQTFDLVVSNAVIEHVGGIDEQLAFVREHVRVGRDWVITTPNRWFPVESHTSTLLRHWSSRWRVARTEFTRLLSGDEFRRLLPSDSVMVGRPWQATFLAHSSSAPADAERAARRLGMLRRGDVSALNQGVWESLGSEDPDWAVLTDPGRRHGGWQNNFDDFYESGRSEVAAVMASLPPDSPTDLAVDWGSGTGRLTFALAETFSKVLAVDVSQSMLRELNRRAVERAVSDRVETVPLDDLRLSGEADLVLSLLVLQHLPHRTAALAAIRSMMGCLRPGGHLVIEIPERALSWRARLQPRYRVYQAAHMLGVPHSWLHEHGFSGISMLSIDRSAVSQTVAACGGVVLTAISLREATDHRYVRYNVLRLSS
jgi:SAM-dependent methyltransferase